MRLLLAIFLLLSGSSGSIAQQPLQGPIHYPQLGISFTVPEGWQAHEDAGLVYMGSEVTPGLILMSIHELRTMDELKASLDAGFSEDGIELFPSGTAQVLRADVASMEYAGKIENEPARGLGIGMLNPHGNGVSIVAMALEKVHSDQLGAAAMKLMESIAFQKIEYTGPSIEHWERHLTNTRLTRIETYASPPAADGAAGGGYSSRQQIDLCDGRFTFSGNSEVQVDALGGTGMSNDAKESEGIWNVHAGPDGRPLLQLDHQNGARSEFTLDEEEGKVYLNGERWFRTWEGDHAPDCK